MVNQIAQLRREAYCVVVLEQQAQLGKQWLLGFSEREPCHAHEVEDSAVS